MQTPSKELRKRGTVSHLSQSPGAPRLDYWMRADPTPRTARAILGGCAGRPGAEPVQLCPEHPTAAERWGHDRGVSFPRDGHENFTSNPLGVVHTASVF